MAPMQVSMRAWVATLAVLGLLAASFAGGASGAGSPNVAALQVGLRTHGLYHGTVDGVLGPRTERAVMRFQRRAGLSPDGVIGARTRKAFGRYGRRGPLGAESPGDRLPRVGRRGAPVRARLARLPVGGLRRRARRAHRHGATEVPAWAGLDPDGTAGPSTYAALKRPVPRSPVKLLAPVAGAYGDLYGPRGNRFHAGIDIPAVQGDARRRRRSRTSRLRSSRRGVRQARRARACTRRQDPLRAPVADHRSRRPVREGPRQRRPRGRDGRGDRPAPPFRSAGPRGECGSLVRPVGRTKAKPAPAVSHWYPAWGLLLTSRGPGCSVGSRSVRRGAIVRLIVIALLAAAAATAVAIFVPWLPPVRSKEAERIDFVFWVVIGICIAVFAVVAAITIYSVMTFRARPDDDSDGPPIHGHTGLEITWTAIPAVLVTDHRDPERRRARRERRPEVEPAQGRRHGAAVRVELQVPAVRKLRDDRAAGSRRGARSSST